MGTEPRLGSKVFYKIGEVSHLTKLPAYVLRFWESQFTFLKPKKSRGNQRLYVQRDVETVLEIKRMLYEEGHTIEGVKRYWVRRGRIRLTQTAPEGNRKEGDGRPSNYSEDPRLARMSIARTFHRERFTGR